MFRSIRALATGILVALPAQSQADDAMMPGLLPEIARSTSAELAGTLVENRNGVVIGTLGGVVRAPDDELHGIVQPSDLGPGVLRGEAFPLSDFGRRGDRLVAPTAKDAAMIDDSQAWEAPVYEAIAPDIPLGQLAEGGELRGELEDIDPIRPFSDLDLDHDGVLTPSEAHATPRIGDAWVELDVNEDGVIDRSEFRALTQTGAAPTAEEARR